ncbi:MAG TPA: ATP-binding protein [Firmicutes bacterium]|nr:ATP-binding protein [Candidatus Fermentithermobacillaceae bacterium]
MEEGKYPGVIDSPARAAILQAIDPILTKLSSALPHGDLSAGTVGFSADAPRFFSKMKFRTRYIEQVLRKQESGGARARDYCGTMLLRMDRLFADTRFEFLFGPVGGELPNPEHVLAAFVRDVLGLPSRRSDSSSSDDTGTGPNNLPFYKRQRSGGGGHHVVILDLSLLAAEVLENVTALIGRLILEFLQRLGELEGEKTRGSLPVVLVLEEAQNYIPERRKDGEESISRLVFERIAREGRKYGLGLVVASQRPSELSKTVLSQCNSFVVHRLQNPEDLRYFKEIVPAVYGPLLDQLPALARQTALVLGECVRAPALVRVREARPRPRSDDPRFYRYWCSEGPDDVPVEKVCTRWEGEEVCDEAGADSCGGEPPDNGSEGEVGTKE